MQPPGRAWTIPVGTSASNSVSSLYPVLRQAGATVRQMLRQEGARQLGRPVEDTAAEQSYVYVVADPTGAALLRRDHGRSPDADRAGAAGAAQG